MTVFLRNRPLVIASTTVTVIVLYLATLRQPTLGLAMLAGVAVLGVGITAPVAVVTASVAWIILVRPGAELLHLQLGPIQITEVELLATSSVIFSVVILLSDKQAPWKLDKTSIYLLLLWPTIAVIRACFPTAGDTAFSSSAIVDLRLVGAYAIVIPIYALLRTQGVRFLINLILAIALIASLISVVAWALRASGLLANGEFAFVHVSGSSAADIRPGGEITVVFAALILITMWSSLGSRLRLALALAIPVEMLLSQTISMLIAIGAGLAFSGIIVHRNGNALLRILSVAGVAVILLLGSGVLGAGSRFDFTTRVDDSSSAYRLDELDQFLPAVTETPATLLLGTGVGTSFVLYSGVSSTEVKRDSHSVPLAVALKTGILGLALFLLPWILIVARGIAARRRYEVGAATCTVGLLVVSLTVPWWWTFDGMVAALVVFCIGAARFSTGSATPNLKSVPEPADAKASIA